MNANAPTRLLDDPTQAATLRADLKHCAQDNAYDTSVGLARFEAMRVAPAASSPSSVAHRGRLWIGIGSAVLASVVALWWLLRPAEAPTAPVPAMPQIHVAPPRATPATPPTMDVPIRAPAIEAPRTAPTAIETKRNTSSNVVPERSAPSKPDLRREIELIARARQAVEDNPALAYRLTQRLALEFPNGVLREEREGLSAIALWNMGEHERAAERARAFLQRYQGSAMRDRLQSITDGTHK